ncbi:hypothetical protein DERP_004783 [Dermatophagoides pteronyssinus]|uniref:Mon2/Sec7/BIG1-like HDS domain-containing protein n=1 Tax=Dermatophagoides pteronyssinus TaxID=6956 RepID=A0ABQ8JSI5_DERPT|nr:hypothetical protein DERP_004783 [Dermatophagoides pteronyssinus]
MERIIIEIRNECSHNMSADLAKYCDVILDSIQADLVESNVQQQEKHLQLILQLFKICVENNVSKLNLLSIDLLKLYIRQTNESNNDSIKEYTINQILKSYCNIFNKNGALMSLELLGFIIEVSATFVKHLTIVHVIDIIELCHKQIKEYVLKGSIGSANSSQRASSTLRNLFTVHRNSNQDKVFSAINMTAGQVCHYFVKNKIVEHRHQSISSEENSKPSQDFIHLMLFLIKKLETKVSFLNEVELSRHKIDKHGDNERIKSSVNETKVEIFILIKTFNCFYLKCIHFILLTIPDAWKHMTNRLMEIIWKYLAPVLIHILNPTSTIAVSNLNPIDSLMGNHHDEKNQTTFFGRGSERLHLTSPVNRKHHTLNGLNYQERQYIYKISIELLRLFGLENSMRPILEALFYRIFLLPPLKQRLDSLIYMQEIFKNPLLVLVLISDPICLFGPSVSNSQHLDLFQIFMDAIKEANLCDDLILNQSSLVCLASLLSTLKNIVILENGSSDRNMDSFNNGDSKILNSSITKMICSYVERNKKTFESTLNNVNLTSRNRLRSTSRMAKYSTPQPYDRPINFSSIKDRIYGYDMITSLESRIKSKSFTLSSNTVQERKNILVDSESGAKAQNSSNYEDIDFHDKLKALISSSTLTSSSSSSSPPLPLGKKNDESCHQSNNQQPIPTFQSSSLHLSFENLHRLSSLNLDLDVDHLRFTNSESKLNMLYCGELSFVNVHDDKNVGDEIISLENSSVFDEISSSDSDVRTHNYDDDDDDDVNLESDDANVETFVMSKMFRYTKRSNFQSSNLSFFERSLAQIFVRKLSKILPDLANCRNLFAVDEAIQSFASLFCKNLYINLNILMRSNSVNKSALIDLEEEEIEKIQNYKDLFNNLFINADGIYLTTYLTLLFNLKLQYSNYYEHDIKNNIPISEKAFVDDIFDYHITIYVSQNFLAEIYQNVLATNLFDSIYNEYRSDFNKLPLVKFLLDIDILDRNNPDAFKLSDYVRLEQMATKNHYYQQYQPKIDSNDRQNRCKQLNLLIKRFFHCFWEPIILCLRQALSKKFTFQNMVQLIDSYNVTYLSSVCLIFDCENKHSLAQTKNTNVSIQIILVLFDICEKVGYYNQIDKIYGLLYQYITKFWQQNPKYKNELKKSFSSNDVVQQTFGHGNFSFSQIIALKTLLTSPIRIGSHCPRIWKNVLDLCKFVIDVENYTFRSSRTSLLSRARVSINTILKSNSMSFTSGNANFDSNLHADHYQNLYDHTAFNQFPGINEAEYLNFEQQFDIVLNEIKTQKQELEPDSKDMEHIIEYLSLLVSQIFETIPLKCNLSLLYSFICELCDYSKMQLIKLNDQINLLSGSQSQPRITLMMNTDQWSSQDGKSLMLFRLVEVVLRFVRNGRPLLHFMKIWPTVSSHLVLASTHKDTNISKKAIASLHDIINAFLSSYSELDFFHFNESLFKPYEKLLRYEMCNSETQQELVLYSICEFVEGALKEIRSGWKSIFKALRGLRLSIDETATNTLQQSKFNCSHHVQILTDTFEAFLRTDNMHVLAYASVDFIPCIFHLIRNFSTDLIDNSITEYQNEVFIIFLKCLQKFSKILRSINEVSDDSFINFHVRIKKTRLLDLEKIRESLSSIDSEINLEFLQASRNHFKDSPIERSSSLLQIWYLFLDEYSSTICFSHLEFRPMLLEVYFTLIQIIADMDNTLEFSVYCFNHIDLPMIQCLFRETINNNKIDELYIFLKSWLQVFNNQAIKFLLAEYSLNDQHKQNKLHESRDLMFQQTLMVYIECLNGNYHDLISILALSLIKHLLLSLNRIFTTKLWKILIDSFRIAHQLTIHPLVSLVNAFHNLPVDINNDLEQIKIITIRNQTSTSSLSYNNNYIQKRARQIFFIGEQYKQQQIENNSQNYSNDNQFISHTIIIETSNGLQQSISFNLFIIQIHNHLTLLQILSSLLTFNVKPHFTEIVPFFYENIDEICYDNNNGDNLSIPLLNLQWTQYNELCFLLKQSFTYSMKFDQRFGLKSLLRHLAHSNLIPNLFQVSSLVNEENLLALEELFTEIGTIYAEKNEMNQKQESASKLNNRNLTSSLIQTYDYDESGSIDQKVTRLMPQDHVSRLLNEYKKSKQSFNLSQQPDLLSTKQESQSNEMNDEQLKCLKSDLNTFIRIWNGILSRCLQKHIDCDLHSYRHMLRQYQQLIHTMIRMNSYDKNTQLAIFSWIDKLTDKFLAIEHTPVD